jgi:hypothetical protein
VKPPVRALRGERSGLTEKTSVMKSQGALSASRLATTTSAGNDDGSAAKPVGVKHLEVGGHAGPHQEWRNLRDGDCPSWIALRMPRRARARDENGT